MNDCKNCDNLKTRIAQLNAKLTAKLTASDKEHERRLDACSVSFDEHREAQHDIKILARKTPKITEELADGLAEIGVLLEKLSPWIVTGCRLRQARPKPPEEMTPTERWLARLQNLATDDNDKTRLIRQFSRENDELRSMLRKLVREAKDKEKPND